MAGLVHRHEVQAQRTEHAQQADGEQTYSGAPSFDTDEPSHSGDQQPAEVESTERGPLGFSAEWWLVIFTGILTAATIGLIWATHRLGERADRGMRTLERPYVNVALEGANIAGVLQQRSGGNPNGPRPSVFLRFANHGKTPAYIIGGEAMLRHRASKPDIRFGTKGDALEFDTNVIGPGAVIPSRPPHAGPLICRDVRSDFKQSDALSVRAGEGMIHLSGFLTYEDIWGNRYVEKFWAKWNVDLERFEMKREETLVKKGKRA
jgi:hypothetical protein